MSQTEKKLNCWEVKNCGRESGGSKADELGVCPAAINRNVNGIHNGFNGGRCCWAITGTLCGGGIQGMYAMKFMNCENCEFYKLVVTEEPTLEKPRDIIEKAHH